MASSSGSKHIKTLANKTNKGKKRREKAYSNKFLLNMHERHFEMAQYRRLLMERKVRLTPFMAPQFERELGRRQWEQLASYPTLANIEVVKEFYTNARSFGGDYEMYTSYVTGKRIPYDAATIYSFLGTVWTGEQCQFASAIEEDINYAEVERTLCVPGGLNINVGQVIANDIKQCAHAASNNSPLGHPSLITYVCELTSVNTFTPPFERPSTTGNACFFGGLLPTA
ncbi:hypothetical protein LR48_Vigan221s003000 [Vigna angularis]|uniref:Putative plant transposon protein domain-containing protein n=1 Tax=Phaseolus angularis TaxID=3914 RepID=A0A0L9T664_PHAAN|nr:hypothetical protein LR48_Vigan221s003000 [Vigna angularis]